MRFQISELVVTPENQETAKRLIGITQVHDCPELLYLTGPADSGKSVFLEARGTEKDLLSTKKAMYCHASEILTMLSIGNENADNFLNRVGEVDVLLIDDVEDFLKNEAVGAQACKLLINSRAKQGLDAVVASRVPLSELDNRLRDAFLISKRFPWLLWAKTVLLPLRNLTLIILRAQRAKKMLTH